MTAIPIRRNRRAALHHIALANPDPDFITSFYSRLLLLRHGDVVEVEISTIGTLCNTVHSEGLDI